MATFRDRYAVSCFRGHRKPLDMKGCGVPALPEYLYLCGIGINCGRGSAGRAGRTWDSAGRGRLAGRRCCDGRGGFRSVVGEGRFLVVRQWWFRLVWEGLLRLVWAGGFRLVWEGWCRFFRLAGSWGWVRD